MRRLAFAVSVLIFTVPIFAAEENLRLEGIVYTEGAAKEVQVQVWALGDQVAEHPEWQFEAVFDGIISPGKAFSVDLGQAKLPVLVELAARDHVAVSFQVVLPEQLHMPKAWLRSGERLNIRVNLPGRGNQRLVVWGNFWVDEWGSDGRRWSAVVPHLDVPDGGFLEVYRPVTSRWMSLMGAAESGAFGSVQERLSETKVPIKLKVDSVPLKVRVWDARKRPVSGVGLQVEGSPFEVPIVSDDEGRAEVWVPLKGEWRIIALTADSQGSTGGRGAKNREIDLDLEPREDIDLQWPHAMGTVVIEMGQPLRSRAFTSGIASLPKTLSLRSFEFWGPGIAQNTVRIADREGPVSLPVEAPVLLHGRVESTTDTDVGRLPVWVRLRRSPRSPGQGAYAGMRFSRLVRPWLPWAVTDDRGRFAIAGLPPGEYEAEVRAPDLPVARGARLEGEQGAELETVVTLSAGATLALRVVDQDGRPLPGVTVDLFRSTGTDERRRRVYLVGYGFGRDHGDPELTAISGEDGRTHLTQAPTGSVWLSLRRPGSVNRTTDPIEIPAEGIDIGDLVLEPGVTLTGTTVGPDGEPVGDAEVALDRSPQAVFRRATTTSDQQGRFTIPDLEPTGEVYLQARAEGLVPEAPHKVELPPEGEIEVAMARERILEGLVVDSRSDAPIEGASVSLSLHYDRSIPGTRTFGRGSRGVGQSKTDASGRFHFDGLGAGEFEMYVVAEGMRRLQQKVVIDEGDLEPLIIRLEPGLELRGRVEDSDGGPVAGVDITAGPASQNWGRGFSDTSRTKTGADGRFHFDALGTGTQRIMAHADDGRRAQETAEAGQPDEVILRLSQGGLIQGTVYLPDGSPAAGARVMGHSRSARQSAGDESGADGGFELPQVGPGEWTVGAMLEGFASASEEVEVPEGDTVTVDLHFERGATVIGEVRGLSPTELGSCMVQVDSGGSANPASDGTFRVEGVEAGDTQVVAVEMMTRRSRSEAVVVPDSGETAPVVIDFGSGLTASGRVLRGNTGVPGMLVSAQSVAAAGSGETVTGADGEWQIGGLESGEYQIAARSRSGEVLAGDHVLLEADAELDLYLSSGSISGRVIERETDRPIEGATITVTGSTLPPVQRTITSGADGAFRVSDLGDGDYTVLGDARDHMPARKTVSIRDGGAPEITLFLGGDERTVFVVQGADGSPASGIWIQSLAGGVLGPFVTSTCADGGRCEVKDIPRGRWTLLIRGEGMALLVAEVPQAEIPVQLRASGTLKIKAPADDTGAAWQVRLRDSSTGIVVPVYQFENPARTEWVPVSTSGLSLQLPEGGWRIETFAPDGTQGVQQAVVTAGGTTEVTLE